MTQDTRELVERLRPDESCGPVCTFCGRDPYHYVDIGVGRARAAVECCDLGIAMFQHGDEQLLELAGRMAEAATALTAQAERIAELEVALRFYADISKYPAPLTGGCGELYFDCGQVASAALAGKGEP